MKNGIRLLICFLLILVFLFPALAAAADPGQDLRYGRGKTTDQTVWADELFDLLFSDEIPLTEFERTYLRSRETLALTYSDEGVTSDLVSWRYDGNSGKLTIEASAFRYTAQNGEEVVWLPQTVCAQDGVPHPLAQNGNVYSYDYSGVWNSGSMEFTVEYAWTVSLSAATADAILTGPFSEAEAIEAKLEAFRIDHAEWERMTALYNAYLAELEAYQKAHRRWEIKKQNYDAYLAEKADYDARVAEYRELSAAWEAYNEYRRQLSVYTGALERYNVYADAMQAIESRLAIMELMFTPTSDENEWRFYPSIMGESVDLVLERRYELNTYGIPKLTLDKAKEATEIVRPLLERYDEARRASYPSEYERSKALFEIYTEIYPDLCKQLGNLFDKMNAIYGYAPLQRAMEVRAETREKVPHFQQFIAQMYVLQALLDDFETVDLSRALPNKPDKIVRNLVEPALRPDDLNQADPTGVVFPAEAVEKPVAPTFAEKPEKEIPADPSLFGEPEPVEAPGEEPQAPDVVQNPGAEPTVQLTDAETLLYAEYSAGLLPERAAKNTARTLPFFRSVSTTATYQNKRTVTFYKADGSRLEEQTVEYGETIATPPQLDDYQTAQYCYTFLGWIPTGSAATEPIALSDIRQDLSLSPLFASRVRTYSVTWQLFGIEAVTDSVAYGELPTQPQVPTRPDDETYSYGFAGWSPVIVPVSGDAVYTAQWKQTPLFCKITWDIGDGAPVTVSVPYGTLPTQPQPPTRPDDETYSYQFAGWSPSITTALRDATYRALWNATLLQEPIQWFSVTWDPGNGTQTTVQVESGTIPQAPENPTKEKDEQFTYTFTGWTPKIVPVTEDVTYYAEWEAIPRLYTVTWETAPGDMTTVSVAYGKTPVPIGEPERAQDERFTYSFAGWTPELAPVTGDITYTALWEAAPRLYTVTWEAAPGDMTTVSVAYGELPVSIGKPERAQDERFVYTFTGWTPELAPVTGDVTYTAVWEATPRLYTVTWRLDDGRVTTDSVAYGEDPQYPGTPEMARDERFTYSFVGWSPKIAPVTGDVTYTAVWKAIPRLYTVTWRSDEGKETTDQVAYGEIPQAPGDPIKEQDEQFTYTFAGWSPTIVPVIGDITYTAVWEAIPRFFTVIWDLGNGETIVRQVPNGELPVFEGTPTRADDEYSYTFLGWEPQIAAATAAATYTAAWKISPLVRDADGNAYQTETTEESVVVEVAQDELDLKTAIDFAADAGKTVSLGRENATVTLNAEKIKEQLPEISGVRWVEEAPETPDEHRFTIDFVASDGTALQSDLTCQVVQLFAENQMPLVYEVDGDELREIRVTTRVGTTGVLATFEVPAGKMIVCKVRYQLRYESDREYYSALPAYAESGEVISLAAVCDYGYEVSGATLVHENGEETEAGASFTMPAEGLTVKLHITPIVYHVKFVCMGEVLSERDYAFGESIVIPDDPTLPDDGEIRYRFSGWTPQVIKTATGEVRDLTYQALFSVGSVQPEEETYLGTWRFFVSPFFLGATAGLIVLTVAIVLIVRWRKKKAKSAPEEQAEPALVETDESESATTGETPKDES